MTGERNAGTLRTQGVCPSWLSFTLTGRVRRLINDPEAILRGLVSEGETVADIGCGPGFFTIPMARMVGPHGRVLAVDIQQKMLDRMLATARRAGVAERIMPFLSDGSGFGASGRTDFALAFWMLHEVPDKAMLVKQIHAILKPGGRFLFVEPKLHVGAHMFDEETQIIWGAGFTAGKESRIRASRAILFQKPL